MRETECIDDELRRIFDGGAWLGSSVTEILDGIDSAMAAARPLPFAHSIWELVHHIEVWERVVLRRLGGDPAPVNSVEEDWPPVRETSAGAWTAANAKLQMTHRQLRERVITFPDSRLEETAPGQSYNHYVMLHGVSQHDAYHLGQIGLLKKSLGRRSQ